MNPFSSSYNTDKTDDLLIEEILKGDKKSLNSLIQKHQPFIYNIAWKMIGDSVEAQDLTQEALLKIVSNLSSFKGKSTFRTWAYQIVWNHFLNMTNKPKTPFQDNFEDLGNALDNAPSFDISLEEQEAKKAEIREVRLQCLSGMLLCLTKEQRLVYIIGDIFDADHNIGSEIMSVSKDTYRKKLSRARTHLHNFMKNKCGLVDKSNPCKCHKKVTIALEKGLVDAKNLLFNRKEYSTFQKEIEPKANLLIEESEQFYNQLHREHSFKTQFDKKSFLQSILESPNWQNNLNLN
ncbi:MAG: RNA polymerase sigma factor [Winogradskyella sp.]|uniref:RNA polymerase sigma factor n=1 Tax=Winogradskyella sp. TaxID=1883156 RepID=UPI000F401487|nr:RNA polymerase sigma factor [Winogradskyella sp.]RNC85101.1 MAG: RNA polymerase sigma factor [Winogradskyella sp.]